MRSLISALILGLIALILGAGPVHAQPAGEPIATDRPDFTEAAVSVPAGTLQLESGATLQWFDGGRSIGLPEALFRYGLTDRFEARFLAPDYNWARESGESASGFGDLYVGAKLQIGPFANGDDLSLIPALNVPTGEEAFSSDSADPEAKLCYSHELSDLWTISLMAYPLWTTVDGDRSFSYQQTASLGRSLTGPLSGFMEYAGTYAEHLAAQHVAHMGFAYGMGPDAQADLHGGLTMNGDERDPFVGIGYSVRFQ